MSIRERILLIRLIEKIEKNPSYAKVLGIDSTPTKLRTGALDASDPSGCCRSYQVAAK